MILPFLLFCALPPELRTGKSCEKKKKKRLAKGQALGFPFLYFLYSFFKWDFS